MAEISRISGRRLLPQLYFHLELRNDLTPAAQLALKNQLIRQFSALLKARLANISYRRIADLPTEELLFDVQFDEGSLKLRVEALAAAAAALLAGCAEHHATYRDQVRGLLEQGKQVVRQDTANIREQEIRAERRLGEIARLDDAVSNYQRGEISLDDCVQELVRILRDVNESPDRRALIGVLRRYIDYRFPNFDWQGLQNNIISGGNSGDAPPPLGSARPVARPPRLSVGTDRPPEIRQRAIKVGIPFRVTVTIQLDAGSVATDDQIQVETRKMVQSTGAGESSKVSSWRFLQLVHEGNYVSAIWEAVLETGAVGSCIAFFAYAIKFCGWLKRRLSRLAGRKVPGTGTVQSVDIRPTETAIMSVERIAMDVIGAKNASASFDAKATAAIQSVRDPDEKEDMEQLAMTFAASGLAGAAPSADEKAQFDLSQD